MGVAVRREWPDGRHDLFGFTRNVEAAMRGLTGQRRYWQRSPLRPTATYLVAADEQVVRSHPVTGCRAKSCPGYLVGEGR
ncbi:hypothetical protein GCM10027186_55100 [Micromonospora schwarzwaldensis]